MAGARPSSQHLQMSTSVSDTANWAAEFTNFEVPADDETLNHIRFRSLPFPPRSLCQPLTRDPHFSKWTFPNFSTFQPGDRMDALGECYPYSYSAVYETIDDDDDDAEVDIGNRRNDLRVFPPSLQPTCGCRSYYTIPENSAGLSPNNVVSLQALEEQMISGQILQTDQHLELHPDLIVPNRQMEVETQFDGSDRNKPGSVESQVGFWPIQTNRSDVTTGQGGKGGNNHCSNFPCISIDSVSSRNCTHLSPSILSGCMDDFCPASDLCQKDIGISSRSKNATVHGKGCENQNYTDGDRIGEASEGRGNTCETMRIGQLFISANSAFHSPKDMKQRVAPLSVENKHIHSSNDTESGLGHQNVCVTHDTEENVNSHIKSDTNKSRLQLTISHHVHLSQDKEVCNCICHRNNCPQNEQGKQHHHQLRHNDPQHNKHEPPIDPTNPIPNTVSENTIDTCPNKEATPFLSAPPLDDVQKPCVG
ncbi:hypothetical protein PoB_004309900 [Plakobranchus ocellatus]|uniref:Uncharacterized protein n=1 Tax=Plakobranchus ocellatus TaxID=259542 RepID=A0AAV4B903_9GAST|nr:hypothetical protein PoB_004309900 [Plakobranchus ocellatus]